MGLNMSKHSDLLQIQLAEAGSLSNFGLSLLAAGLVIMVLVISRLPIASFWYASGAWISDALMGGGFCIWAISFSLLRALRKGKGV